MGTTLIKAKITDQILEFTLKPTVASGGVNEDVIEFEFDELWDGFDMVAVFYRSKREVFHQKIVDNRCTVPSEVLRAQGVFYVGVMGVKDNVTRTTNVLRYELEHGAITVGVEPPEPTPSIYESILASVKSAEQIAQSVRNDADAGRFNGIPGEKGDKGDPGSDASVTAENIQTALGYAPVKDVQVAGSSVLVDGVANVAYASTKRHGVVRIGAGIGVTNNGDIYIQDASRAVIGARTQNNAITPYQIDYAVKAAMCDGKGAAWTSDEQMAARERIGVDKAYELIEEITTDGTAIVERTQESDGTPYNFVAAKVSITSPKNLPAKQILYARVFFGEESNATYSTYTDNSNYFYRVTYNWKRENNVLTGSVNNPTIIYNAQDKNGGDYSETKTIPEVIIANENFTKLRVYAVNNAPVPAGFLIQIYGVRA